MKELVIDDAPINPTYILTYLSKDEILDSNKSLIVYLVIKT